MSGENANDAILRQEWKKPTSTSNSAHDFFWLNILVDLKKIAGKVLDAVLYFVPKIVAQQR